ncbi:MAG: YqgE/AlgH family protein [Thermoleophilia bacterium]
MTTATADRRRDRLAIAGRIALPIALPIAGPNTRIVLAGVVAAAAGTRSGGAPACTPADEPGLATGPRQRANGYKPQIDSLRGQLLIAGARLPDPNFARSVVLVCEHSAEGALGLVLNRPGELLVGEAAPELADLTGYDALIDEGGPVQPDALLVLAEFDDLAYAGIRVVENVGLVGDGSEIEDLVRATRRARVFAGYAGWGPGQLDAELERADWFVAPAGVEDIFNPDADELWARVLARKGGQFALVARMPIDPSVN